MDRLYLNGYVPVLQRPENLWWYLVNHKGYRRRSRLAQFRHPEGVVLIGLHL